MLNRIKLQQIYRMHKDKKERLYLGRVLDIDHGTFTPLVFTTTGGIGDNAWHVRTIISVALLRLAFNCVRQKIGTSSALKLLEVSSTRLLIFFLEKCMGCMYISLKINSILMNFIVAFHVHEGLLKN